MRSIFLYIWYKVFGCVFRLIPIKKSRITFENFYGKGYGDNPKYICDELLKRGNYDVGWLVKGEYNGFPATVKQIKRGTFQELLYLGTSSVWVDNTRKNYGITKRKKQLYIQTWHGGIPLKKIEKDIQESSSKEYIKLAQHDSSMIDLLLVSSERYYNIFRKNFWYDGEILKTGFPRNDIFFKDNSSITGKVKQKLRIDRECHFVLYAPTFREGNDISAYDIDYEQLVTLLERYWGGQWKIVLRLHPNISHLIDGFGKSSYIINGTEYNDISELIIACDLLITDYSSCMFDAVYAKKKIILYASDKEKYLNKRGLYIQYADLPFLLCENMKDLEQIISKYDEQYENRRMQGFLDEIGSMEDGKAAQRVCDRIEKHLNDVFN